MKQSDLKDVPVSIFLAVSIIVIFSLYTTTAIKSLPCGKDLLSTFYSNFVHTDIYHVFSNLFALYALSRVERAVGAKQFISLVLFILIFNTVIEVVLHKIYSKIPCSIGFSGVLFGVMTWELVRTKKLDLVLAASIIIMIIVPSLQNPRASLLGHTVGAITGIAAGLIWNKIYKKKTKNPEIRKRRS